MTKDTSSPSTKPQTPSPRELQNEPSPKAITRSATPKSKTSPNKITLPRLTSLHFLLILTGLFIIQIVTISLISSSIRHQQQITNASSTFTPSYNFTLEQLEDYPDLQDKLQTALPSNSQIITLIEYLSSIAGNFNSQINVETNEPLTSPDAPVPYISFSISGHLNLENITQLIKQIEQPSFLIDITNLQATTPTGLNQNIDFILKARAYVAPE